MRALLSIALVCCCGGLAQADDVIYDNDIPDGTNAYSAGDFSFGYREAADDFVLDTDYPEYNVTDMHFSYVWYDGDGLGYVDEVEILFYDDVGGAPSLTPRADSPGIVAIVNQFYTGAYYVNRPEVMYEADFDITLPSGEPFWFSATLQDCPENGFWLTSHSPHVYFNECYVSMPDYGFPKWTVGTQAFGVSADLSYALTGVGIPEPATLSLLALGGLALIGRR